MADNVLLSTKSRILLLFRIWSAFYDNPLLQNLFYGPIHKMLLQKISDLHPEAILDAGCGTGELLLRFSAQWPEATIIGLDLSRPMLKVARQKEYGAASVSLVEQSVYDLPFKDEAFDLITNTISSHFYLDFDQALSEFSRVLKPGGRLLMGSLSNGVLQYLPGPWQDQLKTVHSTYRSLRNQRRALEKANFHVASIHPLPGPVWLYLCLKQSE